MCSAIYNYCMTKQFDEGKIGEIGNTYIVCTCVQAYWHILYVCMYIAMTLTMIDMHVHMYI